MCRTSVIHILDRCNTGVHTHMYYIYGNICVIQMYIIHMYYIFKNICAIHLYQIHMQYTYSTLIIHILISHISYICMAKVVMYGMNCLDESLKFWRWMVQAWYGVDDILIYGLDNSGLVRCGRVFGIWEG